MNAKNAETHEKNFKIGVLRYSKVLSFLFFFMKVFKKTIIVLYFTDVQKGILKLSLIY